MSKACMDSASPVLAAGSFVQFKDRVWEVLDPHGPEGRVVISSASKQTKEIAPDQLLLLSGQAFEQMEEDLSAWAIGKICNSIQPLEWIINDVLVKGKLGCLGGYAKTGKTGFALDLAVSVATGGSYLNQFQVQNPGTVIFYDGETGLNSLVPQYHAICRYKEIDPTSVLNLHIIPRVPNLTQDRFLKGVEVDMLRINPSLVIIDPTYIALPESIGPSLGESGEQIMRLAKLSANSAVTILMSHHTSKTAHRYGTNTDRSAWPELDWLTGSGWAEAARQFILLHRASPFTPGEPDELRMVIAGRDTNGWRGTVKIRQRKGDNTTSVWYPDSVVEETMTVVEQRQKHLLQRKIDREEATLKANISRSNMIFNAMKGKGGDWMLQEEIIALSARKLISNVSRVTVKDHLFYLVGEKLIESKEMQKNSKGRMLTWYRVVDPDRQDMPLIDEA